MPGQGDDPVVRELRAAIDAADRDVLAALNRRIDAVRRLHDHKAANGYSLSDPSREAAIVVSLQEANEGPMADESVPRCRPCCADAGRGASPARSGLVVVRSARFRAAPMRRV